MASVLCLVRDLMDRVKIEGAASGLNFDLAFVSSTEKFLEKISELVPSVIILDLDLNQYSIPILDKLKVTEKLVNVPKVGFYQHTNTENAIMAKDSGCDIILMRSVFSERLPGILKQYAPPA